MRKVKYISTMGEVYGQAVVLGELDGAFLLDRGGWVFWFPVVQCYGVQDEL